MKDKKEDQDCPEIKPNKQQEEENPNIVLRGQYEDFIGFYPNFLEEEWANEVMEAFDYYQNNHTVYCEDEQFPNSNAGRFDWAYELGNMSNQINGRPERDLNEELMDCFKEYCHVFGHLKQMAFYTTTQKVQKTPAGGGYHVWHDENSNIDQATRSAVWMMYLNDNFEGGETEFLYYKRRIKPKKNSLLIWPAGLTHAHRGGLVTSGNKYIITGWFNIGQ